MAFQANAFQSNAFQICASTKPDIALQRRRAKRWEEIEARRRYEEALEVLEQVEDKQITAQLEAVILPFRKEDEEIDMAELMRKGQAKRRLEQILTSIRRLEDEMLELLALLLLANEAL